MKPIYTTEGYTLKKCACGKTVKKDIKKKLVLKAPANPVVTVSSGKNKVTLKWREVSGATGYKIYMKTSLNVSYKLVKTLNAKTLKFTKSGLKSKSTYYFKVKAYKKADKLVKYSSGTTKTVKVK